MDWYLVIAKTYFRDVSFSGSSCFNFYYKLNSYYELSLNVIANVLVDHD